jgi:two-component system, OmpR family, sensor histidine kinase KdpD
MSDVAMTERPAETDAVAGLDDIGPTLIATVSHDLRSPLAAAMTAIDCLSYQVTAWSADEVMLVASARNSLAQISRLIEGLLDANRIQDRADAVQLRSTELTDVVRAALSTVPEASRLTVDLPTGLPNVRTDPVLLERVIANVVANALRFSPHDTPPRLVADSRGPWLELRVMDQGPGVSLVQWEKLFQPFERLSDAGSATGLGLGLAISRTLANAIGAQLHPESTAGGGLTMVIALPVLAAE